MEYIESANYSLPRKTAAKRSRRRKVFGPVAVGIGILVALFGGLMVLAAGFVLFIVKHSDAYATGRDHFVSHPAVIADLGSPIHDGLIATGSLKRVGAVGGHADLSFSLSGPKGEGQAHVVATRGATGWTLHHAEWTFRGVTTQLITPYGAPAMPTLYGARAVTPAFRESRRCTGSDCGGAPSY